MYQTLEEGYQYVSSQSIVLEQRVGYIFSLVLSVIILTVATPLVLYFAWGQWWILMAAGIGWLVITILLLWFAHVWPSINYRCTCWRLDDIGLEIRRGVWWKHRIAIPVARVQHVDVSQGPVQRMFGLGKITINTAGTSNASIEFEGLAYDQALGLRDQLIAQKEASDVL